MCKQMTFMTEKCLQPPVQTSEGTSKEDEARLALVNDAIAERDRMEGKREFPP